MSKEEAFPFHDAGDDLEMENIEDGMVAPTDYSTLSHCHPMSERRSMPLGKPVIIVKEVGKSFGYKALVTRLTGIWRPKGNINMIDLDYDFFLVKFT